MFDSEKILVDKGLSLKIINLNNYYKINNDTIVNYDTNKKY